MDIVSTFNPPRMVMLAGETFWIRAISQEDYAILVAWLDDVLPGAADRTMPPKLTDEESQKAINSAMGWTVLAWAALRHVGVSYKTASKLILQASEVEKARFTTVLFHKRPTYQSNGEGSDLGEAWWGPSVAYLSREHSLSVPQIAAMTLDQVDMLIHNGLENESPNKEEPISLEEMQRRWEEARAEAGGAE